MVLGRDPRRIDVDFHDRRVLERKQSRRRRVAILAFTRGIEPRPVEHLAVDANRQRHWTRLGKCGVAYAKAHVEYELFGAAKAEAESRMTPGPSPPFNFGALD